MTSAVEPSLPDDGARRQTTVARTNGSPRRERSAASARTSGFTAVGAPAPAFAAWIASHTFPLVSGMSMLRTPRGHNASITAFTNAAGDPTVADSPTPLAPIG